MMTFLFLSSCNTRYFIWSRFIRNLHSFMANRVEELVRKSILPKEVCNLEYFYHCQEVRIRESVPFQSNSHE